MEAPSAIALVAAALFFTFLVRQFAFLRQRLGILSRLVAKLDLLLAHAGVKCDPLANLPLGVLAELQRGARIEAIKLYRTATGCDLKEAKDIIEELQRRTG